MGSAGKIRGESFVLCKEEALLFRYRPAGDRPVAPRSRYDPNRPDNVNYEEGIDVADAHALWQEELAAGKTSASLLLNNINHPNDYGHTIYHKAFLKMLRT